mmetsp:Transcript_6842/g.15642  ORF Transcript_6842/g.15642 Transcript_6842/m.15642 type:complete len:216 (+) Transcript_6842:680-1327(+)
MLDGSIGALHRYAISSFGACILVRAVVHSMMHADDGWDVMPREIVILTDFQLPLDYVRTGGNLGDDVLALLVTDQVQLLSNTEASILRSHASRTISVGIVRHVIVPIFSEISVIILLLVVSAEQITLFWRRLITQGVKDFSVAGAVGESRALLHELQSVEETQHDANFVTANRCSRRKGDFPLGIFDMCQSEHLWLSTLLENFADDLVVAILDVK